MKTKVEPFVSGKDSNNPGHSFHSAVHVPYIRYGALYLRAVRYFPKDGKEFLMHIFAKYLAATAAAGALAVPAIAQQPYAYPQQNYPVQTYPPQAYPPGYATPDQGTSIIGQIVDQLLGNRYTVSDRTAVGRCASAALTQAERQYRAYGYNGYGQQYGEPDGQSYNQQRGYNNGYAQMRVTAITGVQRRSNNSLRVSGLIASGTGYGGYGGQYGNQGHADPRYAQTADLSFRCNVDYRGAVSGLRVSRYNAEYRR
jgi:hypothetical protein